MVVPTENGGFLPKFCLISRDWNIVKPRKLGLESLRLKT
jgi:hypothetical protein